MSQRPCHKALFAI